MPELFCFKNRHQSFSHETVSKQLKLGFYPSRYSLSVNNRVIKNLPELKNRKAAIRGVSHFYGATLLIGDEDEAAVVAAAAVVVVVVADADVVVVVVADADVVIVVVVADADVV